VTTTDTAAPTPRHCGGCLPDAYPADPARPVSEQDPCASCGAVVRAWPWIRQTTDGPWHLQNGPGTRPAGPRSALRYSAVCGRTVRWSRTVIPDWHTAGTPFPADGWACPECAKEAAWLLDEDGESELALRMAVAGVRGLFVRHPRMRAVNAAVRIAERWSLGTGQQVLSFGVMAVVNRWSVEDGGPTWTTS
jgi:hypothetical protein